MSPAGRARANSPTPNFFELVTAPGAGPPEELGMSASDIERFIYMFADRFFQDHQYEYPQTLKIFQEFKTLFFNERIICMKSKYAPRPLGLAPIQPPPAQFTPIDELYMRGPQVRHPMASPLAAQPPLDRSQTRLQQLVSKWKKI